MSQLEEQIKVLLTTIDDERLKDIPIGTLRDSLPVKWVKEALSKEEEPSHV